MAFTIGNTGLRDREYLKFAGGPTGSEVLISTSTYQASGAATNLTPTLTIKTGSSTAVGSLGTWIDVSKYSNKGIWWQFNSGDDAIIVETRGNFTNTGNGYMVERIKLVASGLTDVWSAANQAGYLYLRGDVSGTAPIPINGLVSGTVYGQY